MIRPLELVKEQVLDYAERAATNVDKNIKLSKQELQSFRFNMNLLCYEAQFGQLDDVFRNYFNSDTYADGVYSERDLTNLLTILNSVVVDA